ncbi:MAG: hypothetical protein SWH68_05305 [Thermodesulfobacteriota bacterium]|nr:hypothetical protein [Thermodesulfobacteriota bacterium]
MAECLRESDGDIEHAKQAMRVHEYDGKTGPKHQEPAYIRSRRI